MGGSFLLRYLQSVAPKEPLPETWKQAGNIVVLTVNGEQVTQREWVIQFQKTKNSPGNREMTAKELKIETLKEILKQKVLFVDAWEKGFRTNGEEARTYTKDLRVELQSGNRPQEEVQFFSDFIKGLGISDEEYWGKIAPEEYLLLLPQFHLKESLFNSFPDPSKEEIEALLKENPEWEDLTAEEISRKTKQEKFEEFWEGYIRDLLKKARIEILSPDLKEVQNEAFKSLGLL